MVYNTLFGLGRSMSSVIEGAMDPEIEAITLESVEECAGDPFEFATAIMYEQEMAMQQLDMAVMCCEYAYLKENGTEMVYEAGVLKNFFDAAKKKVKEWWEKIVKFFKKVFNYVANFERADEQFVKKYEKAAKKAGKVTGLKFKGYKYDVTLPATMMGDVTEAMKKVPVGASKMPGNYDDDLMDGKADKLRGSICKKGDSSADSEISASDFKSALAKALRGGASDKEDISVFDCAAAIEEIKNAKKTKKDLQTLFDKAKSTANIAQATLSTMETEAKKAEAADIENKAKQMATKAAHNGTAYVTTLLAIATVVNNEGAKAITANNRQNRAFLPKALSALSKSDKLEADRKNIGESTSYDDVFSAFGM